MNLAGRAREIFESSEADKKRQLLDFSLSELATERLKFFSVS